MAGMGGRTQGGEVAKANRFKVFLKVRHLVGCGAQILRVGSNNVEVRSQGLAGDAAEQVLGAVSSNRARLRIVGVRPLRLARPIA